MDGHTLQLHLAQDGKLKNLPVVVITAVDSFESLFAKFPQVKKYITKPFDPVEVSKTVSAVLKKG
jgi:CheY-like chemotaxis protein